MFAALHAHSSIKHPPFYNHPFCSVCILLTLTAPYYKSGGREKDIILMYRFLNADWYIPAFPRCPNGTVESFIKLGCRPSCLFMMTKDFQWTDGRIDCIEFHSRLASRWMIHRWQVWWMPRWRKCRKKCCDYELSGRDIAVHSDQRLNYQPGRQGKKGSTWQGRWLVGALAVFLREVTAQQTTSVQIYCIIRQKVRAKQA